MKNADQNTGHNTGLDTELLPARLLEWFDQLVYLIAGHVLVVAALAISGYSLVAFVDKLKEGFLEASITLINGVLLALIVLEPQRFSQAMIELGVSGGLIVAIGVALVIT